MSQTKYLKGDCSHCGGRIEYPAELIGIAVDCPHCGQSTDLTLATPPHSSTIPRTVIVWTIIAVLVLGGGLAGAIAALHRAQRLATARQQEREAATAAASNSALPAANVAAPQKDFLISPVLFEKTPGTSLIHAVGSVTNLASKQRFGVKLELDLLDQSGRKIGIARDYQPVIEAGGQWRFHAPVIDSKAASAVVSSIKED